MKLLWTPQATEDRKQIYAFIREHDEDAAEVLDHAFIQQAQTVLAFPEKGKPGRVVGTRELVVHKHYILVYACTHEYVAILTVLHTSRQWPPE